MSIYLSIFNQLGADPRRRGWIRWGRTLKYFQRPLNWPKYIKLGLTLKASHHAPPFSNPGSAALAHFKWPRPTISSGWNYYNVFHLRRNICKSWCLTNKLIPNNRDLIYLKRLKTTMVVLCGEKLYLILSQQMNYRLIQASISMNRLRSPPTHTQNGWYCIYDIVGLIYRMYIQQYYLVHLFTHYILKNIFLSEIFVIWGKT